MRAPFASLTLFVAIVAATACATIADSESTGQNLPSANIGPFRPIAVTELGTSHDAPNAEDDDRHRLRDASILDLDGDPSTLEVWGFFAANAADLETTPSVEPTPDQILRSDAQDGRSFDRAPIVVLAPTSPWEGGTVGAPSVLRVGGEVFLYYAAKGGIGLARSPDGTKFTSAKAPVLAPAIDANSWEGGAMPASPGVVRLPDGTFRMFYEIAVGDAGATSIGEASSVDGVTWSRVAGGPALAPSPHGDPEASDAPYDDLSVGSPFAITGVTEEGTAVVRVYYGARDSSGNVVIGLAARFGNDGPLVRATTPVYGTGSKLMPREPCVSLSNGYSLLFVTERAGVTADEIYSAVAVGVAPPLITLPPPFPM